MLDALLDALSYAGSSLDKLGPRPLRGLLGGKPHELASIIPFSDTLGITNPADTTSGRDLTNRWGITDPSDKGWGAWGAGVGTEALLDPLALFGAAKGGIKALGGLSRAMKPSTINPVHHLAGLLGDAPAASRAARDLSPMESALWAKDARRGALGLKYDPLENPPGGIPRNAPEWVNEKTFYHGSGTPGLKAEMLDPMKTAPENIYGRGIYTTADEGIGKDYQGKGIGDALALAKDYLRGPEAISRSMAAANTGSLDEILRGLRSGIGPEVMRGERSSIHSMEPARKSNIAINEAKDYLQELTGRADVGPGRFTPFPEPVEGLYQQLMGILHPGFRVPVPTVYQAQSNFGKVLDLNQAFPTHRAAKGFLEPFGSLLNTDDVVDILAEAGKLTPGEAIKRAMSRRLGYGGAERVSQEAKDPIIEALKSLGYDAMTHTGGLGGVGPAGGKTVHQVVIGLDPRYRQWEPMR